MKPTTATAAYGYQELRLVHNRYMMLALMLAIAAQLLAIGGYRFAEWLRQSAPIVVPHRTVIDIINLPLPPPVGHQENLGTVSPFQMNVEHAIPVPVPDCIADTTQKIAGVLESPTPIDVGSEGFGDGTAIIVNVGQIADPDPSPGKWVPRETDPIAISSAVPEYPDLARRTGIEGDVMVNVLVDQEGRVKRIELLKTTEEIFSASALDAAKKWAFTPALMNGKPVAVWVSIPFRFRLTK